VTEVETKVKDAEGIALWTGRLGAFVQSGDIYDVARFVQSVANRPESQRSAVQTFLQGTGTHKAPIPPEEISEAS
jgi:hypothetical protein